VEVWCSNEEKRVFQIRNVAGEATVCYIENFNSHPKTRSY